MKEISGALVGIIKFVHEDDRRVVSECNMVRQDLSVQKFFVKASSPLGNHNHQIKAEVFVVVKGSGYVVLEREGVPESRRTVSLQEDSVVYVPRGTTHTFVLEPESKMYCFSSRAFNPKAKDMYTHMLVNPEDIK
jgi:mannose-6-phosphate isomerase-like protein (cupin superfamily)